MTTMFSGAGFGGQPSQGGSLEARALAEIDWRKQTFVNKDFVKNMQWLNQSVTTVAQFSEQMQKSIDSANSNIFEQIQGIFADMFVIFAGLEPTGWEDFGNLFYVLQGLGALLGIDPDTPFPLNLIEASYHFLTTYLIPLPQFTDVIFDAIIAWAEELGFSDEAIDAIQEFDDAVVSYFTGMEDLFDELGQVLRVILNFFGLGTGFWSLGSIGQIWEIVVAFINNILSGPRQLLMYVLSQIVVVIFKVMTWIVQIVNPQTWLDAIGLNFIGSNTVPEISSDTQVWNVGSNPATQWVYDANVSSGGSAGSFKTNGTGGNKRILTQATTSCTPGEEYVIRGKVKWDSIPPEHNTFGPCIVFYTGSNEISQTNANVAAGHGATGDWEQVNQTVVVPQNIDGFRIGCRISNEIDNGQVWVDEIECMKREGLSGALENLLYAFMPIRIFNTLIEGVAGFAGTVDDLIGSILSLGSELFQTFIDAVIGIIDSPVESIISWANDIVLTILSPLNALNLFGSAQSGVVSSISTGAVGNRQDNYLINATFESAASVAAEDNWSWDDQIAHNGVGCAKVIADGRLHQLVSNEIFVTAGENLEISTWVKWENITYTDTDPILVGVTKYLHRNEIGIEPVDSLVVPAASGNWKQISGTWKVPEGVDEIRLRLAIYPNLSSGTVYFDDATAKKTDLIRDEHVPGVVSTVDNTVQALFGWTGDNFTHTQAYNAMVQLAAATTANTTAIAAILAEQTTGVYAVDDFKRIGANMGGDWTLTDSWGTGAGTWKVNGEEAYWYKSGETERAELYRWIGTNSSSSTDYQKITVVLGSAPENLNYHQDGYFIPILLPPFIWWIPSVDVWGQAENILFGRADSAGANRIEGGFRGDGLCYIDRLLGGVRTRLAEEDVGSAPGSGSSISLICGTSSGPRYFQLLINNQTVLVANDSTSNYGASYRHWGAGGYADHFDMPDTPSQAAPGKMNSWFAQDN